jgi:hypothetical protein
MQQKAIISFPQAEEAIETAQKVRAGLLSLGLDVKRYKDLQEDLEIRCNERSKICQANKDMTLDLPMVPVKPVGGDRIDMQIMLGSYIMSRIGEYLADALKSGNPNPLLGITITNFTGE